MSLYVLADATPTLDHRTVYRFAYKYLLDSDSDYANPTLDLKSISQPAHDYPWGISTSFYSFSQSGRGIISRYTPNTGFESTPYSVHQMLNCKDDKNPYSGQLPSIGVSPNALHMEYYSGDVAFATLDSATVVVHYYG